MLQGYWLGENGPVAGRVSTNLKLAFLSDLNGILWLYKLIWIRIDN